MKFEGKTLSLGLEFGNGVRPSSGVTVRLATETENDTIYSVLAFGRRRRCWRAPINIQVPPAVRSKGLRLQFSLSLSRPTRHSIGPSRNNEDAVAIGIPNSNRLGPPSLTEFDRALFGFTGFCRVLPSFLDFRRAVLLLTRFDGVFMVFFNRFLMDSTR